MRRYHVENCNTGDRIIVVAQNKKTAHECASYQWPGVPVEIYGEIELKHVQSLMHTENRMAACMHAARAELDEFTDAQKVVRLLKTAEAVLQNELKYWEDVVAHE